MTVGCHRDTTNVVDLTRHRITVSVAEGSFDIGPYQFKPVSKGKNIKIFSDQTKLFEGTLADQSCAVSVWGD